jgi:hypothetical protein
MLRNLIEQKHWSSNNTSSVCFLFMFNYNTYRSVDRHRYCKRHDHSLNYCKHRCIWMHHVVHMDHQRHRLLQDSSTTNEMSNVDYLLRWIWSNLTSRKSFFSSSIDGMSNGFQRSWFGSGSALSHVFVIKSDLIERNGSWRTAGKIR